MLSKVKKGAQFVERITEKGGQRAVARTIKPPLSREAIEKPAAKPYERSLQQGYEHDWLHGTTGDITEFKPELRGETTGAASAKKGFFFVRDPISPPPSMIEKSKAEHEEVKRLFSQHNIPVDENSWMLPFQGTGAETASGYAKIGGSRTYKEAMRKVRAAEQRGDWAEYEKYLRIAEDAETQAIHDAQRLVAEYGDRRDEMTDAIQKAVYDRPLPQPDAEKLDEWYKSVMPPGWYNFYNKAQFDNLANQLIEKVGPEKAEAALDAMQRFQSTAAERRLAEGSQEGANVMPVALRYANPYVHDFEGSSYRDETYSDLVDKAIRGGHDALILRNTYDPGGGPARLVDVGVVFEPGQIRSKFAEFDPTEVGNPDITKAKGGAIDHGLKAWHEKNMAKGGEVRMSNGGASEHEGFFESGLPPSPIADEILVGRGVRRKAPRIGEIFETPVQAVQGALGAFGSAGKGALQATVGLPGDIISLGRGVGAAVSPQPGEDRLGAFLRGMEGETGLPTTEDVKKFLDQYGKAPFEQFETLGEFTGIPILTAPKVSGAIGRAAEDIAPYLRDLPVGASIKPVGPGGEKVSINELIRRLEAGEEMTPEEMQKAQYSKAQKEKYAQANILKAQKEPAPKEEAVKVPANEMGFFSSVEKAAANLKREEGSGDAFLSDIMKFNPSAGELEATGIVDFLKGKKSVTRQEVQDYIDQHSVQIKEVVRGTVLSDDERKRLNDLNRQISQGYGHLISPEDEAWFEATRERLSQFKEPRFERENLILPGGKNYKEILLKFPISKDLPKPKMKKAYQRIENNRVVAEGFEEARDRWLQRNPNAEIRELPPIESALDRRALPIYKTIHWPDDPNTFMHLRMQDMTIGGKKTLVIEEIQSDWHQTGRKEGYRTKGADKAEKDFKSYSNELADKYDLNPEQNLSMYATMKRMLPEEVEKYERLQSAWVNSKGGVPDAPFKKDWYQLGVKRLLKYAADNDYDQVALVGPDEQIRRGSLGTHIDGLIYEKNADGTIKLMAEKGESVVLDKTVEPKDLDLYVGKDVAKKILDSKETDGTLTGDDLKIGGEGMRQYYGRNYPEYMNKLGKKYGTEAKKTKYTIKEFEPDDVEEVYTGEFDRYGREIMAFKVVDRETGEDIAFEYDFDKVLKEANKKAPATDMWLMDLPAKMKSDVKIGQPFKEGGAVTKDKDLMRWHKIQQLAAGGAIRKLAKSAEKALEKAKRMTREEAEKAGLWHDISDIKLEKPLSEVQKKVVKNPKSKLAEKKVISPEELQGGTAVQLLGDRAAAGQILEELEGVPMNIELQGGPGFMREHGGWASHKVPLSKLEKKIRTVQESGDPVYGVYTAMGPQGVDFNTFVSESLVKSLDLSELRKKDIDKFNQEVRKDIPGFVGIESPGLLESLIIGPGAQRTKFVQTMAKEDFQKAGFPNVGFARYAVTEPELLDVPIGQAGYSISQFGPEMKMEQKSGHRTYPYDLTGTYIGGLAQPLPAEVMFPSFFEARRLLSKPESGGYRAMQMSAPVQQLDQEWLDNAMQYLEMQKKLTGKKKGGLASIKVRNKRNG